MVDLGRFWHPVGLLAFGLLLPNTFKLFGFTICRYRAYLMKVIPEMNRAQ
jgi:hypothetical protein